MVQTRALNASLILIAYILLHLVRATLPMEFVGTVSSKPIAPLATSA